MSPRLLSNASALFGRLRLGEFDQACVLCEQQTRNTVCAACEADLRRPSLATCCPVCSYPGNSTAICGPCLREPPNFDATYAGFIYDFPLDRLVQSLKFQGDLKLVDFFAAAIIARIRLSPRHDWPDTIVALPLANKRLAERGFNQSALIAAAISRALKLPVAHSAMLKVRDTPPQAGLPRDARRKNVRGAFDCTTSLADQHVAIVDDVMTTGSTLSEAAKVLKRAGARQVDAWVVARAVADRDKT